MTDEERDIWAEEVLDRIRRHRRREMSGLLSMMDNDLADCLDALAVAPLLLSEQRQLWEMAEFERRRLAWLDAYPLDWHRMAREDGDGRHAHGGRAGGG